MKYIFSFLLLLSLFPTQAQDSIFVKLEKDDSAIVILPNEEYSIPIIPILSIFVAFLGILGIGYQIRERRKDDILKNQLDRLNKQIAEFYGPLYSVYETGHQNYYAYLELYGNELHFDNPNFKPWNTTIFYLTNQKMEEIIITKADLIIGNVIPEFFFQYCEWFTSQKAYLNSELQPNFDNNIWKPIIDNYHHPKDEMRMYIKASFEVLKETQSEVLSGNLKSINENTLKEKINQRKEEILKNAETNKWEKSVWEKVERNEKKMEDILEQEKTLIKKSHIPDRWKS